VVLDSDLASAPEARIFKDPNALIFAASDGEQGGRGVIPVERVPRAARGLDLRAVVNRLAALEINELLVECGPRLAAGFLEAELVDELILYVAPFFLGADAAPLAALRGLPLPGALPRFEFSDHCLLQNDLRLVLTAKRA
jgi:diaminohydroxyphosphoribosylaminopyrimidine deaminase/5-amino-6-(5-phosphoribosylamino)uracil reductase